MMKNDILHIVGEFFDDSSEPIPDEEDMVIKMPNETPAGKEASELIPDVEVIKKPQEAPAEVKTAEVTPRKRGCCCKVLTSLLLGLGIYVNLVLVGTVASPMSWIYSQTFVRRITPVSWKKFFTEDHAATLDFTDSSEERNFRLLSASSQECTYGHFRVPQQIPAETAFVCDICEKKLQSGEWVYGNRQLNIDACLDCQSSLGLEKCRKALIALHKADEAMDKTAEQGMLRHVADYFADTIESLQNKVYQLWDTAQSAQDRVHLLHQHREDIAAMFVAPSEQGLDVSQVQFWAFPVEEEKLCDLCHRLQYPGMVEYGNKSFDIGCCEECLKGYKYHCKTEDEGLAACQEAIITNNFGLATVPETPGRVWKCDVCEATLEAGSELYGSRALNIDACTGCVEHLAQNDPNKVALSSYLRYLAHSRSPNFQPVQAEPLPFNLVCQQIAQDSSDISSESSECSESSCLDSSGSEVSDWSDFDLDSTVSSSSDNEVSASSDFFLE